MSKTRVRILKSFGGTQFGHRSEGQECDLPDGADWVEAGLAVVLKPTKTTKRQRAVAPKKETAVVKD